MSKICLINQPAGLGDIIFCQKIAYRALNEFGCSEVNWPVSSVYSYISDYIEQENVFFKDESELINHGMNIIDNDTLLYVPLITSDNVIDYHNRKAHGHIKYKFFYDTDYSDWKNYFSLKRNLDKEEALIKSLGVDLSQPYNFINPCFGTPPNYVTLPNIIPNNEYKNVYMKMIEGFTIFDWIGVVEKATEIHTVETSLYYILEKLGIEENVYIYSKYKFYLNQQDDYSYMKSHCSTKWNYV